MKDDRVYITHILECISRTEQYVGNDRDAFMASTLIQDAVLRNLQILAESAQRLSGEVQQGYPEIPWRDIAGFRNILVHDYLGGINLKQVWEILERDLPVLKRQLIAISEKLDIDMIMRVREK